MTERGTLFVIAAASGAGKTTLVKALIESMDRMEVSISYTTRSKRSDEEEGVNYFFVGNDTFEQMIADRVLLEHADVFGHYYGTSKEWVEGKLHEGLDVILEIDWQGAAQVRKLMSESVGIFILPPSREVLRQRLETRNQDTADVIQQRLAGASHEMSHYAEFDFLVINDEFDRAVEDLVAIVKSQRMSQSRQQAKYAQLLEELLKNQ